jgi:hypothetical protein
MGKSITPTYRIEIQDQCHRHERNAIKMAWNAGQATDANLKTYVLAYARSHERGGTNAHISAMLGYIPYPHAARVVRQRTGEVVATWKAGMFQVW